MTCTELGAGPSTNCQPAGMPFLFGSQYRSPVTGLSYMRNRWYHPELRQFLSPDPAGYVDSYNPYAYVAFDPINNWDPYGLDGGEVGNRDESLRGELVDVRLKISESLPRGMECSVRSCSVMESVDDRLRREAARKKTDTAAGATKALATAPFFLLFMKNDRVGLDPPRLNLKNPAQRRGAFVGTIAAGGFFLHQFVKRFRGARPKGKISEARAAQRGANDGPVVKMPSNRSQLEHIFRDAPGHVNAQSKAARAAWSAKFKNVASDSSNLVKNPVSRGYITEQAAEAGVKVYAKSTDAGYEVWVTIRNGVIQNAGIQ